MKSQHPVPTPLPNPPGYVREAGRRPCRGARCGPPCVLLFMASGGHGREALTADPSGYYLIPLSLDSLLWEME